ncbi:MAG: cytochrome c [Lewinellaceae bacterium]|nr:cytochrome c [Lewinellaceae bacterium]
MKQLLVFSLIAIAIIACSNRADSGTSTSATTSAAVDPVDGQKIYKQYCVTCHGLYGDMGASGAFNLTTSNLTLEERVNVITNGRNAMTSFKALLSEEKIKAVAQFTLTLKEEN